MPDNQPKFAISLPNGVCISGVTTWSVELCRRLNQQGLESVLLHHPLQSKEAFELDDDPNLPVVECGYPDWVRNPIDNLKKYGEAAPAIYIPNFFDVTYALCAELTQTIPDSVRVIGYCHSFEDCYFHWLSYYEPIIHKFVAVSRECGDRLKEVLPHRADDIVVRPYGTTVPQPLNRTWSQLDEPLQLIYIGRIDEGQKRVSDFPRLAEKLVERGVDFQLQIIGDGAAATDLREQVDALPENAKQRIDLPGGMPPKDVLPRLQKADCCLLVSAYEGTAIAMLEGMAQGCVPVVTRVSGASDVITSGENGHMVEVGDLDAMVDRLAELASDRQQLAKMGAAAHQTAQRYSHEEYIEWFLDLSDDIWSNSPSRVWPRFRRMVLGDNGILDRTVGTFWSMWGGRFHPEQVAATESNGKHAE